MIIVDNFLTYLKVLNKSQNTIDSYEFDIKLWMRFQFSEIKEVSAPMMENVKLQDLYNYLASINGKATATQARAVSSIKQLYAYLMEFKLITNNTSESMRKPKVVQRLPKFLDINESQDLLNVVDDGEGYYKARDYAMLTLLLNTGIRESELLNINLKHIRGDILTVIGKGDKERCIPLNESCLDAIERYMPTRIKSESNALFINRQAKRLSRHGVIAVVKRYLAAIDRDDLSTHKLRHTAATLMLTGGTDLYTIQEILGHNDPLTTKIYAKVTHDNKRNAVANNGLSNIKRKCN